MPWTAAQQRLFRAAAHSPGIARSHGLTQGRAAQMAGEGVKKATKAVMLAAGLRRKR